MGRAEGYGIVHADEQYIVPTDGKPIRGLIQVSAAATALSLSLLLRRSLVLFLLMSHLQKSYQAVATLPYCGLVCSPHNVRSMLTGPHQRAAALSDFRSHANRTTSWRACC